MDYSTQIAALEKALASGELTVESDGDRVTYRSSADLKAALDYFRQQQAAAAASSGSGRPATTVAVFDPR
jgi:hypothetical protein